MTKKDFMYWTAGYISCLLWVLLSHYMANSSTITATVPLTKDNCVSTCQTECLNKK